MEDKSQKCMDSLRMSLKAAIPTVQFKTMLYGLAYYIYHKIQGSYDISELANKADHLQYLNAMSIDSLKADIFKKVYQVSESF